MDIQAYIKSGVIESYVLGLASAREAAELENLQSQYPEIRQSVLEFSDLLEQQAFDNAVMPPASVKSKIMASIKDEEGSVSRLPDGATIYKVSKDFGRLKMVAAAAVIFFITSAVLNFYLYRQYTQKNKAYQALLTERNTLQASNQIYQTNIRQWHTAAEIMTDPAMAVIKMPGTPGKEQHLATIYWNTENKDVYVMPNRLPLPAKGKQFQLWALVDGKPVDAGVLSVECLGVCKMKNIAKAQAFAITLENEGGSPTPTMQQLYVLGKV